MPEQRRVPDVGGEWSQPGKSRSNEPCRAAFSGVIFLVTRQVDRAWTLRALLRRPGVRRVIGRPPPRWTLWTRRAGRLGPRRVRRRRQGSRPRPSSAARCGLAIGRIENCTVRTFIAVDLAHLAFCERIDEALVGGKRGLAGCADPKPAYLGRQGLRRSASLAKPGSSWGGGKTVCGHVAACAGGVRQWLIHEPKHDGGRE
jgi:hypothetical protein